MHMPIFIHKKCINCQDLTHILSKITNSRNAFRLIYYKFQSFRMFWNRE